MRFIHSTLPIIALAFFLFLGCQQPKPDPCLVTNFADAKKFSYANEVAGSCEGFVPESDDWDSHSAPIVLVRHGNAMNYYDYSYLLEHLAKNGFIAASCEGSEGSLLTHLQTLKTMFQSNPQVPVGLLGHSVGGDIALSTALLNLDQNKPNNLKGILALAPQPTSNIALPATACGNYFVIYGSHDEDVTGWQNSSPPSPGLKPACGFESYDMAGTEANMDGLLLIPKNPPMQKGMLFIYGADHNSFRELPISGAPCTLDSYLSEQTHKNLLKCYATAYFLWVLQNETIYKEMLEGKWIPSTIKLDQTEKPGDWGNPPSQPIRLFFQSSKTRRRVIANFEEPVIYWTTAGLFVATGAAADFSFYSPHITNCMRITWFDTNTDRHLWFPVPNDPDTWTGTKRNVSDFAALSFRAGQIYNDGGVNPYLQDQDFTVWLLDENENKATATVKKNAIGKIPYPDRFDYKGGGFNCKGAGDYSKSVMSTIRIPLSAFEAKVDLSKVAFVLFEFENTSKGTILLDNIEFTN